MYKLPWGTTDNQGGWVEVTDQCNMSCPGCYRQRMEGDKPLEQVKNEILRCKKVTNCDLMVIAGGEPLIYPHIVEVVEYIDSLGLKPLMLTNGTLLTEKLALKLKNAGLKRIHFHVDGRQEREGWLGKNENKLNELRQVYADKIWKLKGIQCGFHIMVGKETMEHIPGIMSWYRNNMHKVQHLSFIALSGLPVIPSMGYFCNGTEIREKELVNGYVNLSDISITTKEILETIQNAYPDYVPSAYLNGDAYPEKNKQLFIVNIGTSKGFLGVLGARSMELTQAFYHLFHGRYYSFAPDPAIGKKVFILALFDKQMQKTLKRFLECLIKDPLTLFKKVYLQSMIIQQPIDFIGSQKNACDHCVNPMIFNDMVINPCELDEYRLYGNTITAEKMMIREQPLAKVSGTLVTEPVELDQSTSLDPFVGGEGTEVR